MVEGIWLETMEEKSRIQSRVHRLPTRLHRVYYAYFAAVVIDYADNRRAHNIILYYNAVRAHNS